MPQSGEPGCTKAFQETGFALQDGGGQTPQGFQEIIRVLLTVESPSWVTPEQEVSTGLGSIPLSPNRAWECLKVLVPGGGQ